MSNGLRWVFVLGGFATLVGLATWWWRSDHLPPRSTLPTALHFTPLSKPRPVPDVPFYDAREAERHFSEWRGKGIVLNFWATWCGPCVREMPSLDRLAGKIAKEGIVVLALSEDRKGLGVVAPFYERLGLKNLEIYLDPKNRVGAEFGLQSLPVTVFIDREGRVLGSHNGFAEWDSAEALALVRGYLGKRASGD